MSSLLAAGGLIFTMWIIGKMIGKAKESHANAKAKEEVINSGSLGTQRGRRIAYMGNYDGFYDDDYYLRESQRLNQECLNQMNDEYNRRSLEELDRFTNPYDSSCGYSFFNDCTSGFGGGCGGGFGF